MASFFKTAFLFFAMSAFTNDVWACAACGFSDDSRGAFISTTVLLTFIPLIVIGTIFYVVFKRVKRFESMDQEGRVDRPDSNDQLSKLPTI